MKKRQFLLLAVLPIFAAMALGFGGCDAISNATNIDVNMPIKINIDASPSTLPNSQANVADVSENQTFKDYKDKIKGADITKLTLNLSAYTGNPDAANALFSKIEYTLKFDPSYGDDTEYTIGAFENVRASDFINTDKSIGVNNAQLNSALDKIKDRPKFTVYSKYTLANGTGTLTTCKGLLTINFKLTASPL